MASLVPLAVLLIVVFGKPHLIDTEQRWEAAFLLMFVTMVDLFGGYTFNIALSRRTMDVGPGMHVVKRNARIGPIEPTSNKLNSRYPMICSDFSTC